MITSKRPFSNIPIHKKIDNGIISTTPTTTTTTTTTTNLEVVEADEVVIIIIIVVGIENLKNGKHKDPTTPLRTCVLQFSNKI